VKLAAANLTGVDRAQPKAPAGELEQRAKGFDGVDVIARGDERHGECRTGHDGAVGKMVARGKTCVATEGGAKTNACVRLPLAPARSLASGAASFYFVFAVCLVLAASHSR
jgi:hypothetical protein